MALVDVVVPSLGASATSVVISSWQKHPGDAVTEGETIAVLATDKGTSELHSPATGVLEAVVAAEGEEVPVGQIIARIGGSPTINILDFFRAEAKRDAERFAALQARAAQTRDKLPSLEAELAAVKAAVTDKSELRARAEKEGLDATRLLGAIAELQARHDALSAHVEACRRELDSARPAAKMNFEPAIKLAQALASEFGCAEAMEVKGLRDCYQYVDVKLSQLHQTGEPRSIEVRMGSRRGAVHAAVKNANGRVSADFRPAALAWLPSPRDLAQALPELAAFIEPTSGALWLSTTRLSGDDDGYRRRSSVNADMAGALDEHAREQLGEIEPIDLAGSYPDNELAEVVRTKVLALTVASSQFKPLVEPLTPAEVGARIQTDWASFVACPWAGNVKGALALLKYHAENGEKPRFWSEELDGHFGFRLRTRDHSWLIGQMFIMPGEPAPTVKERMTIGANGVASLGRLHLNVAEH